MKISTIGDMRKFIDSFPTEADQYPFLVAVEGEEPETDVRASVVANCDDHPDYAMLVIPER